MLDLQDFEKNMRQGSTPTTIGWGKDPAFFSGQVYVQEAAQNESVNQNDLWCLFLVVFTMSFYIYMYVRYYIWSYRYLRTLQLRVKSQGVVWKTVCRYCSYIHRIYRHSCAMYLQSLSMSKLCIYIYIYTHVNHIIHCQCHQVVGLLPTASSCFDRCLRRSYGWHADLRYGGSTRRKDDRSTTCTTKSWIWKLKFWKQNGLFQNQIAECLGTLRLVGEFLWRRGGQWAQRRPLQGGAKVTLSIGHVFFWCFFTFFLFTCFYGSDTNSCGLVVRCWWRISCVQAPCQRCNWRNME